MTIDKLPIDDRYGYFCFTGSDCARFEPKMETDEYFAGGEWKPVYTDKRFSEFGNIYRRRIPAGPGFEIVPLDEVIGDAECLEGVNWREFTGGSWKAETVRDYLEDGFSHILAFRRKSAPKVESGWIAAKSLLPEPGISVEVTWQANDGDVNGWLLSLWWSDDFLKKGTGYRNAHWRKFTPPKPSADDVAMRLAWNAYTEELPKQRSSIFDNFSNGFKAALAYARKEGGK